MPTIYDNIDADLLDGLREALGRAVSADICVGYFNLRGWAGIGGAIGALPESDRPACRLLVGMTATRQDIDRALYLHYSGLGEERATNQVVDARKKQFAASLATQLERGNPRRQDQSSLRQLAEQLRGGRLAVKFFGAYPLHAKLYLAHRKESIVPAVGFVGSSNLTLAGLKNQGELNVDVADKDASEKLARWFDERWDDRYALDISADLADIIDNSWAGGPIPPYHIYIKTAYELSREAIEGAQGFQVPAEFRGVMSEFQQRAVALAVERLNHHEGVIIGDVVGLGKTLVGSAVAKTYQQDQGCSALVICPANLVGMWESYIYEYGITGKVLSMGKTNRLETLPRYKLVVIDESHNLRNRDSQRYAHVSDYIRKNESRVVLLSATPYNKSFEDIGNQLRLFTPADADLGVRPDAYIDKLGGEDQFRAKHNTLISSLSAFEHSEEPDDWRELMRMFMVRRTRRHIIDNYAEYDAARKQHFLTLGEGERFYFPRRVPGRVPFEFDQDKQYAALYAEEVVDIISDLHLPRYGLGQYLPAQLPAALAGSLIVKNLTRAGKRLVGFAKSGLFKRLESSGPAFLRSIRRHIVRNAVYLSALERKDGELPVGDVFASLIDESMAEGEDGIFNSPEVTELAHFLQAGAHVYGTLREEGMRRKFRWIAAGIFKRELARDLREDCEDLMKILRRVPAQWDAGEDRKLRALMKLCAEDHGADKILIFTQFKDTADYLHEQFQARGVASAAMVHGGTDNIPDYVKRFSPVSNGAQAEALDHLRILISTDTLSEGQNLQDAHVVVNFDLPWAIVRLVQRLGRVDRIGQRAREIFSFYFLPADGIENVIRLRERLGNRLAQSAELIGADDPFFEGDTVNLQKAFDEQLTLDDDEGETDLISRCYDIWRQATKNDDALRAKIESLPNVVYSAKRASVGGVLAYIKTDRQQHLLVQMNEQGEIASQSQSKILDLLACAPDEPAVEIADNHFESLDAAVHHVRKEAHIGGALGRARDTRRTVYRRLQDYLEQRQDELFKFGAQAKDLGNVLDDIYRWPLQQTARDSLRRQLRTGIGDDDLAEMALRLSRVGKLCAAEDVERSAEPHIICSMGLNGG